MYYPSNWNTEEFIFLEAQPTCIQEKKKLLMKAKELKYTFVNHDNDKESMCLQVHNRERPLLECLEAKL